MDMLANPAHAAIVRSIVDLGHNLSLQVVGEGVETDEVFATLRDAGCDLAQGYLLARPMPADELRRWLAVPVEMASRRAPAHHGLKRPAVHGAGGRRPALYPSAFTHRRSGHVPSWTPATAPGAATRWKGDRAAAVGYGQLAGRIDEHVITSAALDGNHARRPRGATPVGVRAARLRRRRRSACRRSTSSRATPGTSPCGPTATPFTSPSPRPPTRLFSSGQASRRASWCGSTPGPRTGARSSSTRRERAGTTPICATTWSPFVDAHYRTLDSPAHRGIQGKSSGGFGAMITPMLRPDLFGGLATHAGDALYECCYIPEFPKAARALRAWDGDIGAWWADFAYTAGLHPFRGPRAAHDARGLGVLLGRGRRHAGAALRPRHRAAPRRGVGALAGVGPRADGARPTPTRCARCGRCGSTPAPATSGIWISGAVAFRDALAEIGVTDVRFELFDATHGGIGWRYPLSLAYLAQRLSPVSR